MLYLKQCNKSYSKFSYTNLTETLFTHYTPLVSEVLYQPVPVFLELDVFGHDTLEVLHQACSALTQHACHVAGHLHGLLCHVTHHTLVLLSHSGVVVVLEKREK